MLRFARLVVVLSVVSAALVSPAGAQEKKEKPDKPVLNLNEPAKDEGKGRKHKGEDAKKPDAKPEPAKVEPAKPDPVKPEPAKPEAPKPAEPATHTVKKEAFKLELTLNGTFEPQKVHEVALRPELWQNFVVTKIVEHGAKVKKGDVLIQYETKQLDDVIADAEAGRALADLEFQAAQEQLSMMEETIPMDMAAAERAELARDPRFASESARASNAAALEAELALVVASLGGGKLSVHSSVESSARETGNHISLFIPRIRHG